ncbi:unnamed protein product [Larinioides sclopetarius]|uniref:Uncharacterized protein n=1 Tax=Larinioides sclopetarius TaxID=280406 RepID=A0AAV1ZKD6_9ARAC
MGRKKRYYFPCIPPRHPIYHVAVTSKSLMERVAEVADVFEKYADKSNRLTPKYILLAMAQQNESLLELSECASTPEKESTSPKVKSSPESLSPGRRYPNVTSLKRKLSFDDSTKSEFSRTGSSANQCSTMYVSPPRNRGSPISTATDLILTSHVQHLEFTRTNASSPAKAARKLESPFKDLAKCVIEYASPTDKAKVNKKTESGSPRKEFKIPEVPDKNEKKVSKLAKRPKLCDSLAEIPNYVSPNKEPKVRIHSIEDISPHKVDKMYESPSKSSNVMATLSIESESPLKIESLITSVPIIIDGIIEIDLPNKSEGDRSTKCAISSIEIENLVDDPSRVESITKAVERMKVSISSKKTKGDISPSKKGSNRSPRKSSRIFIPGKDVKNKFGPDPEYNSSILLNANVMAYLKLRLKSILSNRKKCLVQIYNFLKEFKADVDFLYSYSDCVFSTVQDIPLESQVYLNRDIRNLKVIVMKNASELANNIRPISDAVKSDIKFWFQLFNEIRHLNEKHEPFLSEESSSQTTVEFLREYESNLILIWERMDQRVLLGDKFISSLLGISTDFLKLTKDFAKYLIMIDMMKPSSIATSKEKKMHISWR